MKIQISKDPFEGVKCRSCNHQADGTGYLYLPKRGKLVQEAHPMCKSHLMECNWGLWPFVCNSAKCRSKRSKRIGVPLDAQDMIVWIPLEAALHVPLPCCPWCKREMEPASPTAVSGDVLTPKRRTTRRASPVQGRKVDS